MRKICVVTGTRADYGLLFWLMKGIDADQDLQLQVIVTGMHLSPEFGSTYKEIENDFKIDKKIEMLLTSDSSIGVSKSLGLAINPFAKAYEELNPDLVVVLGDRYEIFAAATSAMICKKILVHLHGGESTEGAYDEAIRHSITKMSHLHFTSIDDYRKRVIQLGEHPERVFNVGALGLDNIRKLKLLNQEDLEKSLNFKFREKNILVTFHPVTLENNTSADQFKFLLAAVDSLKETGVILTMANSDTNGKIINKMIEEYVRTNENSIAFKSMGQLRYLSALQFVDTVVGNSSSGILEVPSFNIGTINVGDRQKGRIKTSSVIDCEPKTKNIISAFDKAYSDEFKLSIKNLKSPFGDGRASEKIIEIIRNVKLKGLLKKKFYDL